MINSMSGLKVMGFIKCLVVEFYFLWNRRFMFVNRFLCIFVVVL